MKENYLDTNTEADKLITKTINAVSNSADTNAILSNFTKKQIKEQPTLIANYMLTNKSTKSLKVPTHPVTLKRQSKRGGNTRRYISNRIGNTRRYLSKKRKMKKSVRKKY
jgi:hypothetical protein